MKNILFLFILLLISKIIIAQSVNSISERLNISVSTLAHDSLEGRESGTIGGEKAAEYISNQMKIIGLKPGAINNTSYFDRFTMNYPVRFVHSELKINSLKFDYPSDFGATDFSASGSAEGDIINVGSGQLNAANGNDEYAGIDVKGKIVLFDISTKGSFGTNDQMLKSIETRVKIAEKKGAIGILLHNSARKDYEDVMFGSPFTDSISIPVVYIARIPFDKIKKLKKASGRISVEIRRTTSRPANVVGMVDNKSNKTVIVGAHYDHIGLTSYKENGKPLANNGADDNASGTAMLLELAKWAANNESLRYNYIFVAFAAEEKGLFGSKVFAQSEIVKPENIVYMLNMDMVGRLGCQGDTVSVLGVGTSSEWQPLIDNLESPDFHIKKIQGAPPFSDHAPFVKKGIPIIYFTTGIHKQYHTPDDDTQLINIEGMVELVSYIRNFMRDAEKIPQVTFNKLNFLQQSRAYISVF